MITCHFVRILPDDRTDNEAAPVKAKSAVFVRSMLLTQLKISC
jgi:hypothetical protein